MTHVHLCGWCAIPSRYLLSRAKRPRPLRLVPGWAVVPCQKISASAENGILEDFNTSQIHSQIHFITCHGSSLISNYVFTCGGTKDLLEQLIVIVGLPTSTACQPSADMATGCFSLQRKTTWSNLHLEVELSWMWIWSGCVAPSVGFFPGQSACTGDCIYRASTFASCSNCRTNGLTNKNKTYKKKKELLSEQVSIVLLTCCLPLDLTADSRNLKLNWHGPNTGAPSADWPSGQQLV